jgi:hypothetical protein
VQPTDFARFRNVMSGMAELYQRELSPTLLDAYWLALRDWTLADFEAAAGRLMATAQFMPRPADFHALRRAAAMTAGEAWEAALQACPGWRYGTASVNPTVDRVVRILGGYRRLAMEPLDTQHRTRDKFIALYLEQVGVDEARAALPQIAGPKGPQLRQAMAALTLDQNGTAASPAEDCHQTA